MGGVYCLPLRAICFTTPSPWTAWAGCAPATLIQGGITVIDPVANTAELRRFDDILTTNICFGGPNLRTAFLTLSSTGRLISVPWDAPGLTLNFSGAA